MHPAPTDARKSQVPVVRPGLERIALNRHLMPAKGLPAGKALLIRACSWHIAHSLDVTVSVAFHQLTATEIPAFPLGIPADEERPRATRVAFAAPSEAVPDVAAVIARSRTVRPC